MHSRYAVLFTLLVLALSSLGAAVPAAEGPEDGAGGTTWYGPMLYLKAGIFDPLTDPAPGPSGLRADPTRPYYVIQYDGPIQKAWREAAAEAGVELLDYIPDYGYFARIPRDRLVDARSLDHLRYIGPAHLAYRIHPDLWQGELRSRELTIATWGADAANRLAMNLMMAGAKVISQEDDRIVAWVNPVVVVALARDRDAAVSWVEPHFAPELHLDKDARTSNARQQNDGAYRMNDASAWSYNSATGNFEGWTGENVTVAVLDTGLDDSHPAFTGRIVKYYDYGRDGVRDISGHGTHCAGIVLGNGSWRPSNTGVAGKYSGIAPGAGLVAQDMYGYFTLTQANRDAYRSGATISSNSWGSGSYGEYSNAAHAYDAFTHDSDNRESGNQPMLYVFSAGNDGSGSNTITPPATAKNVITVGATGNDKWGLSSTAVAGFSSRGPCDDGRMKPDVVMPGHMVVSARSTDGSACSGWYRPGDGQTSYVYASGTSMAAPGVAGAAAVLTQYLVEENGMTAPSPAMLKASLINGAHPLSGYEYPGNTQGWGAVDLARTLFEDSTYKIYRDDESVGLDTGEGEDSASYWFMVDSDEPLKVSLVWSDPAGTASTGRALINDLDLEVYAPDGTRYAGNLFESGKSKADDANYQDRVNNVEGFLLDNPAKGIWTIEVSCFNAPQGPQDFALVVSGNIEKGHVDLSPSALSASPPGLEEFETAHLETTIKNLGNRLIDVYDILVEQVDPDGGITVLHDANDTDLGPGKTTQLGWDFTGKRGVHTLRVTLDLDSVLSESDESNNVLEVDYFFKGYDVAVSIEDATLYTDPGDLVDFTLTVSNKGNVADEFRVSITSAPPGWSAQLIADTFSLDADGTTPVLVSVIAPKNATAGEKAEITFTAASLGNTARTQSITITTVVNQIFGLELTAIVSHLEMLPGEEMDYTLRIVNPGNGNDRYEIILPMGFEPGWFPTIPEPFVVLQHLSQGDAVLRLAAPNPAYTGTAEEFTLTVRSVKSGMEAPVVLTAEVIQYYENGYTFKQRETGGEVGTSYSFPVIIDNHGNGPVRYLLSLDTPSSHWTAGFDLPDVTVPGYDWTSVNLSFTVPANGLAGSNGFSIAVIPSGGEPLLQNFTFEVLQFHDLEMEFTYAATLLTQGDSMEIDILLRNQGNGEEEVKVLLPDLPALWTFDIASESVTLPAFGSHELSLVVHTSKETAGGEYRVRLMSRYGPPPVSTIIEDIAVTVLTRPDLAIRGGLMELSSVDVFEGDLVQATLEVENLGETIARDVYVQFLIDGVPLGQALYVAELAPGASELIIGSWNANMTGFHEISVVVDSTRDVDEIREDNNGASVQVKVEPLVLKTSPGFAPLLLLAALASIAVVAGVWRKRSQRRP